MYALCEDIALEEEEGELDPIKTHDNTKLPYSLPKHVLLLNLSLFRGIWHLCQIY